MAESSKPDFGVSRRDIMAGAAGAAGMFGLASAEANAQATAPLRALRGEVKRINIKSIETFDVVIPQKPDPSAPELFGGGTRGRINVVRVETEAGVRGYSFLGSSPEQVKEAIPVLVGKDLFAVETHLKNGLINWGGIEEAIWDAIGRTMGEPVSRLLNGQALETVPVYVTYVWPGGANQEQVTPKDQGKQATLLKQAGFKAMKIRAFRKNSNVDAEACSEIIAAGGAGFRAMVDRTATQPGLWTYEQGLAAAKALEKSGCYWLEEPFARDDYVGPARLQQEVGIIITGGEGYRGLAPYRECLLHNTYQILQPEVRTIAGLLATRKVGVLADVWGLKMAPHGTNGLAWAGRAQCSAAMGSVYQEIAVLTPPALPDDYCTPFLPLLYGEQPYRWRNGELIVPTRPGLGLNIDEAAIKKYRVEDFETRRPPAPAAGAAPARN